SQYFDGLVSGKVRMRPVPSALGTLLRERGRYRVDEVGVSRGFDLAQATRAKSDSSARPAPGGTGVQPAPGGPPVPAPTPEPAKPDTGATGSGQ
ncbi:MAG TPA: hypothetical protein VFM14_09735, partial [Gemmatimonadales bacterium]|nr:hypothetical protein [Gemmatimonadales bacterium]